MTAKDLKNALLQEAVQGKLVPQIASEGNARDLLEQIRKSRHSELVSESKNKKMLKSVASNHVQHDAIIEDEVPFEIPESWCWCRLGEITELIEDCPHSTAKDEGKGYPLIRTPNIGEGHLILKNVHRVSKEVYDKRNIRAVPKKNDLIFAREAPAGNIAVINDEIVCLGQRTVLIRPIKNIILSYFLAYYVLSPETQKNLVGKALGTTVAHVNMSDIRNLPIPLPPLAEQKRIVAALEQFMPLVEAYGTKESELTVLNKDIAKKLKNAILQEAIQGRISQQLANDGSAKDLLSQIRAEKARLIKEGKLKKDTTKAGASGRALPPITEDEIPFEIPQNWCWCRLGEIVAFGVCENAGPDDINADDWILDLEDIEKDTGKILAFKSKADVDSKTTKHIFKKGFVLYSKLRPYLNKCVIAPKDGFCTSEILPLDFGKLVCNKYAQIYLMSPFFIDYTSSLSYGVKMPRLGTEDGKRALFPLPPLAEQKRIVAAVEQLLPLCEKLGR